LLYLDEGGAQIDLVRPSWSDVRSLLMTRNVIANHLWAVTSHDYRDLAKDRLPVPLPSMLKSPHDCQHCFQAAECLLLHAALEEGSEASSGAPQLFSSVLSGLTPAHLLYVKQWVHMLALEAAASPVRALMELTCQSEEPLLYRFVSCHPAAAGDGFGAKHLLELVCDSGSEAEPGHLAGLMEQASLVEGDRVTVSVVANTKWLSDQFDTSNVDADIDDLSSRSLVEPDLCTGTIWATVSTSTLSIMLNDHPKRLMR